VAPAALRATVWAWARLTRKKVKIRAERNHHDFRMFMLLRVGGIVGKLFQNHLFVLRSGNPSARSRVLKHLSNKIATNY
jgi:hypothetical protein